MDFDSELVVLSCSYSDYFELKVSDISGEAAGVVVAVTANLFARSFLSDPVVHPQPLHVPPSLR